MRRYFTYVNPYFDGAYHPIEYMVEKSTGAVWDTLKTNFCVAKGTSVNDLRQLGYIELTVDEDGNAPVPNFPGGVYPAEGVFAMIFKLFPNVQESVEEAKDKVERWTGRTDITIEGDKVIIPRTDNPE